MPLPWFRMYSEARTDAKLSTLTDGQHRCWFALLCFAAEQKQERGRIAGFTDELLAIEVCRGNVELLRETLNLLVNLRVILVDGDQITFVHFAERQYHRASEQPDQVKHRVEKYRHSQPGSTKPPASPPVTQVKRDVTRSNELKRAVTKSNAIDTDSDSDSDSDKESITVAHAPVENNQPKPRKQREPTEHDLYWEEFVASIGSRPVGKSELAKWGTGVKTIRDAGITLDEIPLIVATYRLRCPTMPCNPAAIASHLSDYRNPRDLPSPRLNGSRAVDRSQLAGTTDQWKLYLAKQERERKQANATEIPPQPTRIDHTQSGSE